MGVTRIFHRFHFMLDDKIVYTGIAFDPYRREAELRMQPGWKEGYIKRVGWPVTRDDALAWQQEQSDKGMPIGPLDPDFKIEFNHRLGELKNPG